MKQSKRTPAMTKPENRGPQQADTRFKPGQSGNPDGRPKGARHRTTVAIEALLDGEGMALTRKAIELAKAGDMVALRLCLDRILPPRKDRPITFGLPEIKSPEQAAATISTVLSAVAVGELTPGEASEIAKLVDTYLRGVEVNELTERLERLEQELSK
ncbi:MAG: DUF5681 domain-containing protein [Afipia sp.]|nr:DUF5681 domain-containing protein [Afipia sp.]